MKTRVINFEGPESMYDDDNAQQLQAHFLSLYIVSKWPLSIL